MTSDNLLCELAAAVAGEAATATFACGGAISVDSCTSSKTPKDGTISHVDLRWDSHCGSGGSKISFPLQQTGDDKEMLARLTADCQPATYDVDGNVSKLDSTAFSTNFHPHDCGIIDAIRQVMLPSMCAGDEGIGIGTRGVKAELCNLNVCFFSLSQTFIGLHILGCRYTQVRLAYVMPMLIPHADHYNSGLLWCACHVHTKVIFSTPRRTCYNLGPCRNEIKILKLTNARGCRGRIACRASKPGR